MALRFTRRGPATGLRTWVRKGAAPSGVTAFAKTHSAHRASNRRQRRPIPGL